MNTASAFELDGRVAIVTGASSGLGTQFARALSGAGARVVVAARRAARLDKLASSLPDALAVECDVTNPAHRQYLVSSALDRYGRIDVLVNNAGTSNAVKALDEDDSDFARIVDVNLSAPFALTRMAARHMIGSGSGGVIVNVASILGLVGVGRMPQASYAASKGGMVNLTRELAAQWARKGVRVNALAPGWFRSEMTEELFAGDGGLAFIERNTPMGRAGEAHELDGPLLFLCSDASSFITGHTLVVDGGWTVI